MSAMYSEVEAYPAAWLGNLIAADKIAPGRVLGDIKTLTAADCTATQCHFFAGIGVWSYALRLAGWPDDRPGWTGSCPCQPFSAAGRGKGFADDRHLWPEWFRLIDECRPPIIFGEQVASHDGLKWFDAVQADLERAGYSVGAADLCAAGVGAPHIRQRLYFVAVAKGVRRGQEREDIGRRGEGSGEERLGERLVYGGARELAHADDARSQGRRRDELPKRSGKLAAGTGGALGNTSGEESGRYAGAIPSSESEGCRARRLDGCLPNGAIPSGATRGFWADAEWIYCRDGKFRPAKPGTFPLAHGTPARVGRIRAYGNAIVAPLAATFIKAVSVKLDKSLAAYDAACKDL